MKALDILYVSCFVGVTALFVWVGFDIHHRLIYSDIALVCLLVLRVFWKRASKKP